MKIFFIVVLALNLAFEALAGVTLIMGPTGLGAAEIDPNGMWGMNYGFGALAIASAIIWLWPNRTNSGAVFSVMGMLTTFHVLLSISLVLGEQMPPAIAHGVMAVLSIVCLTQRDKWCES